MTEIHYRDVITFHNKIASFSHSRDTQSISRCLTKLVDEIRNDRNVIPALKSIKEIISNIPDCPRDAAERRGNDPQYRELIMNVIESAQSVLALVITNLAAYMKRARRFHADHPDIEPENVLLDEHFCHLQQVNERLNFLTFWFREGIFCLLGPQANLVWKSLYVDAVYPSDKEACLKWFSELIGDVNDAEESDLDDVVIKDFFINNILEMDPAEIKNSRRKFFVLFFEALNIQEKKMILEMGSRLTEDLDLIGLDYVWRIILSGSKEASDWAVTFLVSIYTNLGPSLQPNRVSIQENFLASCFDRLKNNYDTIVVSTEDKSASRRMSKFGPIIGILGGLNH